MSLVVDATKRSTDGEAIVSAINDSRQELRFNLSLRLLKDRVLYTPRQRVLPVIRNFVHKTDHRAFHLKQFRLLA